MSEIQNPERNNESTKDYIKAREEARAITQRLIQEVEVNK